ncbi:MAG: glycosyltransferase family 4 protein, partial [Myxococcales bacterium]|nr:glycosyltransferase family 4 protein [Myxococcales bacterium]
MDNQLRILNVSKASPGEHKWFDGKLPPELGARFVHCYGGPANDIERRVKRPNLALHRGCAQAAFHIARGAADVVVSHLPVCTKWTEFYLAGLKRKVPHIAFAFNQDPMPTGLQKQFAERLYRRVDRFVVYSTAEQKLYSQSFGIPLERIEMIHWGVVPPEVDPEAPRQVEGDYITSIGRTGRNYRDFMAAMHKLPDVRAVVVAAPENMVGIDVPPNVEVRTNVPFPDTLNILYHSRFMVLPLHPSDIPYGHGTAVLGMHLRRPVVVTAGEALTDYVQEGKTGMMFPAGDVDALADRIRTLMDDQALNDRLADTAYEFAHAYCTEEATLRRVIPLLRD